MYEFEDEDDERPRRRWVPVAVFLLGVGGFFGYRQLSDDGSGGGSGGGLVFDPIAESEPESTTVETSVPESTAADTTEPAATVTSLSPSTSAAVAPSTSSAATLPRPTTSAVARPTTTGVPRPTTSATSPSTAPETTAVETTAVETTAVETTAVETTAVETTVVETTVVETTEAPATSAPTTSTSSTTTSTTSTTSTSTTSTLPPPPPEASRLPDGTELSALVNFDGDIITVTGAMPSQQALDHLLEFVNLANATDKPVESTAVVAPGAVGGDFVRFVGLDPLAFPEGTPVIGPSHTTELNRLAQLINGDPALRVIVIGRSDQRGDDARNLEVSQRRAEALVDHLVGQGVDPARLSAIGIGEAQPTSPMFNATAYELNRRAEFVVFGFGPPVAEQPVDTEPEDTEPVDTEPAETTEP